MHTIELWLVIAEMWERRLKFAWISKQSHKMFELAFALSVYILFWLQPWWALDVFTRHYNKSCVRSQYSLPTPLRVISKSNRSIPLYVVFPYTKSKLPINTLFSFSSELFVWDFKSEGYFIMAVYPSQLSKY